MRIVLQHSIPFSLMSETPSRRGICVLTFNIAKHYMHLDVLLETLKDDFDVLFIQEPPWQLLRHAPSAQSLEGERVVGAPMHPNWTVMIRTPEDDDHRPRVISYVSKRLAGI